MNEIVIEQYKLPELKIKDYELIKKAVEKDVGKYQKYVVTKETLDKDIKKRAELRTNAKDIDDKRKSIDKVLKKPIDDFKKDCDYLKKLYEDSADLIDVQIKVFEEKSKESKKKDIQKIFDELVGKEAISELINLDMLFDERYLNKGYELKDVEKDLFNKIRNIVSDLGVIKSLKSEHALALTNQYLKDFNLGQAIAENSRLLELTKKTVVVEVKQEEIKEAKIEEMKTIPIQTEDIDPIQTYRLEITGKVSQHQGLLKYLDINNMTYINLDKVKK